jgi:predicted site-specific integrase-resolvase
VYNKKVANKIMTVNEVAKELGISDKRVREYCRAGKLGTLWQRRWVITREEFEHFRDNVYTGQPGRPLKEAD